MTARPLIHIGMAKAASTFLQLEVFPNAEGLRNLGKHRVGEDLRTAISALTRRTSADRNLTKFRQPFDATIVEAARKGLRPVLSDEDLSVFKFLDPEMMARRLQDILGAYDVLFLIREPAAWVRSHYLFRLEHQDPIAAMGFDRWLRTHLESRRIGSDIVEIWYEVVLRTYSAICRGNVHILPYELMRADKARFAAELSAILGTPRGPLLALLDAPPNAAAHKLRITAAQQQFYELFRWVVLEQPDRAETEMRKFLARPGTNPVTPELDHKLAEVAAAPAIDRKAWSDVFRSAALLLPQDEPAASPVIPKDVAEALNNIARRQTTQLKEGFDFSLNDYGLSYSQSK